jgi:hypothetical protein
MSSTTGDHSDETVLEIVRAIVFAAGLLYMVLAQLYRHGTAAHGDAAGRR